MGFHRLEPVLLRGHLFFPWASRIRSGWPSGGAAVVLWASSWDKRSPRRRPARPPDAREACAGPNPERVGRCRSTWRLVSVRRARPGRRGAREPGGLTVPARFTVPARLSDQDPERAAPGSPREERTCRSGPFGSAIDRLPGTTRRAATSVPGPPCRFTWFKQPKHGRSRSSRRVSTLLHLKRKILASAIDRPCSSTTRPERIWRPGRNTTSPIWVSPGGSWRPHRSIETGGAPGKPAASLIFSTSHSRSSIVLRSPASRMRSRPSSSVRIDEGQEEERSGFKKQNMR